jgi:hypothetical protein
MLARSIGSMLYLDGRGAIGHHSALCSRTIAGQTQKAYRKLRGEIDEPAR